MGEKLYTINYKCIFYTKDRYACKCLKKCIAVI